MNIVFMCKHNRFRSKVAEAYFNKVNKNKKIKVYSAGIFKGFPVAKTIINIGKGLGFKIKPGTKTLREALLVKTDLVIITANNVPASLFKGKARKVEVWKIPDCSQYDKKRIRQRMQMIMKKVDQLNKRLERRGK